MQHLTKFDILKLIEKDSFMMDALRAVADLNLPDSWIGAGFVRGKVWDYLHGYKNRTPLPDIDVIYFDKNNVSEEKDKRLEKVLKQKIPGVKWSVKNQARMHKFHNHAPYKNSTEALSFWVETATCIGVRLKNNKLELAAPRGTSDLVSLILRPSPTYANSLDIFYKRIEDKNWIQKWPKLKIQIT